LSGPTRSTRNGASCSTCHPTTRFAWLTELSGKNEDEIIDYAGYKACTVCYPKAPLYPSFIKGQKEAEAAEAAKTAGNCEGSGRYVNPNGRRWVACPVCERNVGVSQYGKLRPHKTPEAERAAARDKALADPKAITAPDGSPLKVGVYGHIKTLHTAKIQIVDELWWALHDPSNVAHAETHRANARTIAEAISAKTGDDVEELFIAAEEKAAKKLKRQRGY
jgi:hypothetical protein